MIEATERAISSLLNMASNKCDELVDYMLANTHRSLQQRFTHLCVRWLEKLAYQQGDGRNTRAILLARQFVLSVPLNMRRGLFGHTTGPEGIGRFEHRDE